MKNILILIAVGFFMAVLSHFAISSTKALAGSTMRYPGEQGIASTKAQNASTAYLVRSGDTLWGIAQKYHVDVAAIRTANPKLGVRPQNMIYVGETLNIPNKEVLTDYEKQVLTLINSERAKAGLKALSGTNTALNRAAKVKAQDMAATGRMSHSSDTLGSFTTHLRNMGVTYRTAGENIAQGQQTPQAVVAAWMNSPGHRANIMNAAYTHLGVGQAISNAGRFWATEFIGQ